MLLLLLLPLCLSLHAGDDRPGGIVSTYNSDGEQVIKVVATGQVVAIDEWDAKKERWARVKPSMPRRRLKGAQLLVAISARARGGRGR